MPWFEDFTIGDRRRFGRYAVTHGEVIAFARAYDPQPFHLDDAAAARTHFGRLSASGWHTAAMAMAMIVAAMDDEMAGNLGAAGIDELRWLKPVHPGDVLRCESEVLDTRASRSRPGMGSVRQRLTVFNQNDEPVMRYVALLLHAIRPAPSA